METMITQIAIVALIIIGITYVAMSLSNNKKK